MADREPQALNIIIVQEIHTPGPLNPIGQPTAGTVTTKHVPARRYDAAVRDEVQGGDTGKYFGVNDSRYLVRFDAVNPWRVNDVFTDEAGATRRVVGIRNVQQQGHISGGMIEMIARGT